MAKRIKDIDIENALDGLSQDNAIELLKKEGEKLERIAIRIWRKYMDSYKPRHYANGTKKRTLKSLKAIKLGNVKMVGSSHLGIELTWDNELVYHDSAFKKGNHKQGHAVMLISDGWRVKKGRHKDVYRFGYYEGFDYLGKIEKAYNLVKDPNVSLEIQWSGKYLR